MVESAIKNKIGDEKMKKIEMGLPEYIKVEEKASKQRSSEVYEAIEILSALSDFEEFKSIMLAKKSELESGKTTELGYKDKGVL